MIGFVGSLIFFQDFFFLLGELFGQIESVDDAGVLQEAGDADSRAQTRSQVQVGYLTICHTSTSITLPHAKDVMIIVLLLQMVGR